MKSSITGLIALLSLTLCSSALANGPEYYSSKDWILEKAHFLEKDKPQQAIYLGVIASQSGFVVPYRKNLKIHSLLDMTCYKQVTARVTVLRKEHPITPVFDGIVEPSNTSNFNLRSGDVVWVVDPNAPQ